MNKAAWFVLGFAGVAVVLLYLWLRPPPPAPAAPAAAPAAPAAAAPPKPAPSGEFVFEVAGGTVRGPLAMVVRQGAQVSLRVRSDVTDELHVHGYDLSAPLPAAEPVALTFLAARAGRFEVELHHSHRELGVLEVQPQ
jgi:hypothetical protein